VEEQVPDTWLLEQVKKSDQEAFRILFERYQPMVFRRVMFQTGQKELAHDIVQETFIRVWEHRQALKPQLSFPAYLFRISGNMVNDAFRHRNVRERLEEDVPIPNYSEGDHPEEVLQLTMLQTRIHAIIHSDLPPKCREIFLLSRFEEKSHLEIASMLHISVRTVEHQIAHALKILHKRLKFFTNNF
jgi:RNA polymerase sigma-70 factor (ECF subfamily)